MWRSKRSPLEDRFVEIAPGRIGFLYQPDLPRPRPLLQPLFAMDRVADVLERLGVNKPVHRVLPAERASDTFPVLKDASRYVARHPDVERAVRRRGHDVDPAAHR